MSVSRRLLVALGVAAGAVALAWATQPPTASAARGITLGLTDSAFEDPDAATRHVWLDRAAEADANLVILPASWAGIAPASPSPGFDPRDPADPAYDWSGVDAAVEDADARGFEILLGISGGAPAWAEGANRPAHASPGTWKPDPGDLGDFARAVAERYSGEFSGLPRVKRFQLWGEPNLSTYLTPQWHGRKPVAAAHYRRMLSSFYEAVHSAHAGNLVVTGGTAPYGDNPGGSRTPPVRFWREVFCLRGSELKPKKCAKSSRARFDVLAHHPINVGGPNRHARSRLDASTPDIGRIKRVLRVGERKGRAKGAKRHPIWATEIWWDSKPPDPRGVPAAKHARWLQEALYVLWKQGVRAAVWFLIRDQAPGEGYASSVQSGLFLRDGGPKPAFDAFRFPFVAHRGARGVLVWGKAPSAGRVEIERRRGGGWRPIAKARAGRSRVFKKRIGWRGKAKLRARQGDEASLTWALR